MDCNKEEACRAKALAEDKMQSGDFPKAQKLVMKAQRLFSGLDSLPQMLAVCDVHCSADQKINGLENWYGILQVTHFSNDAAIKKQYKKLALLLHPDKNQFPGAEAAFKLVGEANRLLADKEKRSQYDIKRRIYSQAASRQLNANSGRQFGAASSAGGGAVKKETFWTCCEHCGYKYKYLGQFVNSRMYCSRCQRSFMAYDIKYNRVPPRPSTSQKEVDQQGPCKTPVSKNVESNGVQPRSVAAEVNMKESAKEKAAAEVDEKECAKEKFNEKIRGGDKDAEVRKPKREDGLMKNDTEPSKPEECYEGKMDRTADLPKADGLKPQPEVTETVHRKLNKTDELPNADDLKPQPEFTETVQRKVNSTDELPKADGLKPQPEFTEPDKVASKSVPDESVSKSSQASSVTEDKRKRKIVEEPTEDKADSKDNSRRTSPRKRQKVSCAEKGRSDGALNPPSLTSRSKVGLKSERTKKKQKLGVDSGGSSASSCVLNGKANKRVGSGNQERLSTEDKKSEGNEARGEEMGQGVTGKIDNNQKPITQDLPDPDFHNFELPTSSFAVNQVWSLYDPTDGMPRSYARITKVIEAEFKVCITWLDPLEDSNDNSVPIACGVFQDRETQEVDDRLVFSCQMLHSPGDSSTVIYPRRGEVWAVFRGWDNSWIGGSDIHKGTYEYDFVEVLCDFNDVGGVGVAYLGKVEGFVSLFSRDVKYEVLQLQIPPNEILRFSHKVPSFKLTGREREGVPPGCFELDTAALPKELFEVANSKACVGLDSEMLNGKTGGPVPEASKVEVQAKKRQKLNDDHSSSSKASEGICSNHGMNSVKKSKKSVKPVDGLNLRQSPRVLSETNNGATSSPGQEKAEKKTANHDVFCFSDEAMTTPKKPAKVVTAADSSRIRKTDKSIGNSEKRGRNDESLSHSRGNGLLNGAEKSAVSETHGPSSCTTRQENAYNFKSQRSEDKFQVDQIWAIYSNDDNSGMPRKYAQVKRIDTSPEFKLHVAPLELCRPPNLMRHPVCCGCFKLKTGTADVLVPSRFSQQIKAVKSGKNRYEVYPGKGEIWAVYKNWNTTDYAETEEELEIVEVVETNEQSIQVVLLTAPERNKLLYRRCLETVVGFVDIPKTELNRFSHKIPSFRRERSGDYEWWELDSKALID
ncbi:DNAJ heat shock N-terminal domain-containing protein [Hirschfeldia incana]|nr:DNAJ heat shock N-terminal domain-containing protein [Hirschfeldia incana]